MERGPSVLARGYAHHLPEGSGELSAVVIAVVAGDLQDAPVAGPQLMGSMPHFLFPDVVKQWSAIGLAEAQLDLGGGGVEPL